MSNVNERVLIMRFAEVTGYSENAVRHKVKSGTWVGNSFVVFDVCANREHHQKGGAA